VGGATAVSRRECVTELHALPAGKSLDGKFESRQAER